MSNVIKLSKNSPPLLEIEQVEIEGVNKIPKNTIYYSNGCKIQCKIEYGDEEIEIQEGSWLGLFEFGSDDSKYLEYQKCVSGVKVYTFTIPRKATLYQIRYFKKNETDSISISKIIRAGPIFKFDVKLDQDEILVHYNQIFGLVDVNNGFIGIYNEENVLDNYKNIDRSEGKVTLKTPLASGKYKVRLMWENTSIVESQILNITGKDEIECNYKNDYIHSKIKLLSFDPFWSLGWIAIYDLNEKNNSKYLQFYHLRSQQGEFSFGPISSWKENTEFEIRVFPKYTSNVPILFRKINIHQQSIKI